MLFAQGPAHAPSSVLALVVTSAIAVILWWRVFTIRVVVGPVIMLGLSVTSLSRYLPYPVRDDALPVGFDATAVSRPIGRPAEVRPIAAG